jgi:hypothetical protein
MRVLLRAKQKQQPVKVVAVFARLDNIDRVNLSLTYYGRFSV